MRAGCCPAAPAPTRSRSRDPAARPAASTRSCTGPSCGAGNRCRTDPAPSAGTGSAPSLPRVLHGLGATAGARGVVRPRDLPVPGQHLAECRVHRVVRAWPLGPDAAVDLVGRGRHEVVPRARPQLGRGVRAGGDRLRLQRRERPVRRRLGRDDAAEIRVEGEAVDDGDPSSLAAEGERPVVRAPVEFERCAGAVEDGEVSEGERRPVTPHREGEPRPDPVRPGGKLPRQPPAVGHDHRRRAAHGDGCGPLREQDAHAEVADAAHLRARVVVGEDPAVLPAVERVAVRAPLAQADAVAPAVAGDDQRRPGTCGCGGRSGDRSDQHDRNPKPHPQIAVPPSLLCQTRKRRAERAERAQIFRRGGA